MSATHESYARRYEAWFRDPMIVCSCNVLSDGQVRACLNAGPECPRTAAQVYQCLGCSPKCGRCARTIRAIVAATLGEPAAAHVCAAACATACPLARAGDASDASHHHVHAEAPSAPGLALA